MDKNICFPNYDRSILSISSSILKNYGVNSNYKSLNELDIILSKKYRNVIFLILDCLGTDIIEKNLDENSLLRKNIVTSVTSVYPPTTAAATTAFHSGLSPLENGWVGWMPYFKKYNSIIELFSGKDFYTRKQIIERPESINLEHETIYEKICNRNKDIKFHKVFPKNIQKDGAQDFKDLCNKIKNHCNNNDRNLISAYWNEPDHTIHHNGVKCSCVKEVLENIENHLKNLVDKLEDSVVIISADHGAVNVDEIYINEIPEINDCLKMPPSIETRIVTFFIKKGMKNKFKNAMNKYFEGEYILYTKKKFLDSGLFGKGKQHQNINDYLGDYTLVFYKKKSVRYSIDGVKEPPLIADHGGISKEEMTVPLIVLESR